jgi:serine/threonine protein kinase/tetratricopeptide (TPR) repeat protein
MDPGDQSKTPSRAAESSAASALHGALALSGETPPAGELRLEQPGDRIGPYQLLERLGEGGCGVVYLAEQTEPIRRSVALKVIKPGMDSRQVISRFEAERRALALMDHPNIARVLDAGATAAGRPFFVMELVRGQRITSFCDAHRLPVRERLELFKQVCHAVQHAHQKGVIHRDLKPANILVTLVDGVAVPKVIDFGIAKAMQVQPGDLMHATGFRQFVGTAAYMSPEQAELGSEDLDTRSDIYTLGVLLYELLTSRLPFDPEQLKQAGFDELRRVVRDTEPARPSTRLSALGGEEQARVALNLRVGVPQLLHLVEGDLDWIVMKCLEKDRERRYETAGGLTQDLERHLRHEPVSASPPDRLYRLRKFIRRNRRTVSFLGALALVVLLGVIVSVSQAVRATRAEREQSRLRELAQDEARTSRQTARFLREILYGVMPSVARGRDSQLLREVVDRAAAQAVRELTNQPAVEVDVQITLAEVYESLGDYAQAERSARRALELNRQALGEHSRFFADANNQLAVALDRQGKYAEAEAYYRVAVARHRDPFAEKPVALASALNNLGNVLWRQDKLAETEACYREALTVARKLRGEESRIAALLGNLGILAGTQNKPAEAEAYFREVLALQKEIHGMDHPVVAQSLNNLGRALLDQQELAAAEAAFRESLAIRRKLLEADHPDVASSLHNLGRALEVQGQFAEAEAVTREALAIRRKRLGNQHGLTAASIQQLASVLHAQNRNPEAEPLHREALAIRRKILSSDHSDVAQSLEGLADTLVAQGSFSEVEALYREATVIARKRPGEPHLDVAVLLGKLGAELMRQNRVDDAIAQFAEAVAIRQKLLPSDNPALSRALTNLDTALRRLTNSPAR